LHIYGLAHQSCWWELLSNSRNFGFRGGDLMLKIRDMRVEDAETVAKMVALDHDDNPEKGYREARAHTLDHLKIVPQHCYVVEDDDLSLIHIPSPRDRQKSRMPSSA